MMLSKLVIDENVKFDYCEEVINGIPTPFSIISEDEWRKLRHAWANSYCGYTQIHDKEQLNQLFGEDDRFAEAHMDFNADYGVAEIIRHYTNERVYVKIGCTHDWECIDSDKFMITKRCKICGTVVSEPTGY